MSGWFSSWPFSWLGFGQTTHAPTEADPPTDTSSIIPPHESTSTAPQQDVDIVPQETSPSASQAIEKEKVTESSSTETTAAPFRRPPGEVYCYVTPAAPPPPMPLDHASSPKKNHAPAGESYFLQLHPKFMSFTQGPPPSKVLTKKILERLARRKFENRLRQGKMSWTELLSFSFDPVLKESFSPMLLSAIQDYDACFFGNHGFTIKPPGILTLPQPLATTTTTTTAVAGSPGSRALKVYKLKRMNKTVSTGNAWRFSPAASSFSWKRISTNQILPLWR